MMARNFAQIGVLSRMGNHGSFEEILVNTTSRWLISLEPDEQNCTWKPYKFALCAIGCIDGYRNHCQQLIIVLCGIML